MIKKIILIILNLTILIGLSLARETDYLEYADIPDTDIINMNGQFDSSIYEVYINTGNIFYITGSDNKLHNCFKLIGTGYTEKLGEIYFQYEGNGSYVCDDFKLRGVFKIGAGGWGYMEDLENNPEKWKNFLDKTDTEGWYYHNEDGNGNGIGKAFIDGIGYSNWDTVKTKTNLASYFSKISITPAIRGSNINADGETKTSIDILIKYNGDILKNFSVDDIYFKTGYPSDVEKDGVNIPALKYVSTNKTTNDSGIINGEIISYNGNKNLNYGLAIKIGDYEIKKEKQTSSFKYPFSINLDIINKESDKILVGYTNQAKLSKSLNNINSLNILNSNNKINYGSYLEYFITDLGNNIDIDGNYHDIKVSYNKFFSGDNINISYLITGDYEFLKNGEKYLVKGFSYNTNGKNIYKDGEVDSVEINSNGAIPQADGRSKIIYSILFLDKNGFKINNLDYNLSLEDTNKNFDLTIDNNYSTGFILQEGRDTTNGIYGFSIKSYKPVKDSILEGLIKNINYNGHYTFNNTDKNIEINNINFINVTDSLFEDKILKINRDDNIKYSYQNNISGLSNPYFIFTGYAIDCTSCNFRKGKMLSGNNFDDYNFDILIESEDSPSAIVYSGYYQYYLNGDDGNKLVQVKQSKEYSPLLFIQSGKVKVLGNILTNKDVLGGIEYIATNINPSYIKNKLKKLRYDNFIKGTDIINIVADQNIDLSTLSKNKYVYKCNNNTLNIYGNYNHSIDIYTLGCKINIVGNIYSNGGHLSIYAFSDSKVPNLYSNNGWDIPGNIFIKSSIKTIQASLITEGSIFTYKDNLTNDNIFGIDRISDSSFKNQLYIRGKVYSKNTLGGGNKYSDGTYMVVNGKKINENNPPSEGLFNNYSVKNIAQAYDISFFKSKFVHSDGSYNTGDISEYIYRKYNCSGDSNTDKDICYTNIVIEDVK